MSAPSGIRIAALQESGYTLGLLGRGWSRAFLAALLSIVCCAPAASSQVRQENACTYFVSGDIDSATPRHIEDSIQIARRSGCGLITFRFDSNGGDVRAAIAAGDLIRSAGAITIVPLPASCASACVFAFVGGANRFVVGRVGLHRPYPTVGAATVLEASAKRDKINAELRGYLTRMGIPSLLLDEMNSVPPGSVRWLDGAQGFDGPEIRSLQISGEDPAWADYRDTRRAKDLGISLPEFYKRQQRAEVVCPQAGSNAEVQEQRFKCIQAVLAGKR